MKAIVPVVEWDFSVPKLGGAIDKMKTAAHVSSPHTPRAYRSADANSTAAPGTPADAFNNPLWLLDFQPESNPPPGTLSIAPIRQQDDRAQWLERMEDLPNDKNWRGNFLNQSEGLHKPRCVYISRQQNAP